MSRKVKPVSSEEFQFLIEAAIKHHFMSDEPIPKLNHEGIGKLESSLRTPFSRYFGFAQYPSLVSKGAILFYLLCKNHCLLNGNKRMACLTTGWFFHRNGYELLIPQDFYYFLAITVVNSDESQKEEMLSTIRGAIKIHLKKR
jgi:death on curing protein